MRSPLKAWAASWLFMSIAYLPKARCGRLTVLTSGASNSARYWRRASSRSCNLAASQVPPTTAQPMIRDNIILKSRLSGECRLSCISHVAGVGSPRSDFNQDQSHSYNPSQDGGSADPCKERKLLQRLTGIRARGSTFSCVMPPADS